MRLIISIASILVGQFCYSQTFLMAYKEFETKNIKYDNQLDSLRKTDLNKSNIITKSKIRQSKKDRLGFLDRQILEFSQVFSTYESAHYFNFNTSDILLIFYQTNIQTNLSDFIIISNKDTINYGQKWKPKGLHHYEKEIIYKPFITNLGYRTNYTDDRDTILTLANKRDFTTIRQLEKQHPVLDGASSTIILAKKVSGNYVLSKYYFRPIGLVSTDK